MTEKLNMESLYKEHIDKIVEKGAKSKDLRIALRRAIRNFRNNTAAAFKKFPDSTEKAKRVRMLKEYSINHIEELVEIATASFEENHAHVHFAKTAEDANKIIGEIVGTGKRIVKGKSMLTEEIELRQYLQDRNNKVFETDLGEFLVQLLDRKPMHLLAPAVDIPKEKVREILEEFSGDEIPNDIPSMVAKVREILREEFVNADVGINGANAVAADTGTMIIIENEGNVRLATGLPDIQIAVIGVEKIVPTLADAMLVAESTWRNANYKVPSYVNLISGPSKTGDIEKTTTYGAHGPRELHVVFVDNGRLDAAKDDVLRQALYCMKCGACLYECPIFEITAGHWGKGYVGGIGTVWDVITNYSIEEMAPQIYTCMRCNRCVVRCPMDINVPDIMEALRTKLVEQGTIPPTMVEFIKQFK